MATTRGRVVLANQVVYDQVDFFHLDGFTRVVGLVPGHLELHVFFNNVLQAWDLVLGTSVADAKVTAGYLYFNEIPGVFGFYNLRFRPNALGFWRIVLTFGAGSQVSAQDFDVVQSLPAETGLKASFLKPDTGCGC